jgi:Aspartyl protease
MKAGCKSTWRSVTLTEPSRRANAPSQNASASGSTTLRCFVPKLTEGEKKLLEEHEGCFKCRNFFVTHRSNECPSGFPNAATYKTLTSKDVDTARCGSKAKPLAAVSAHISEDENASTVLPIAMVMGQALDPVAYVPSNNSSVIESEDDSASVSSLDANVSLPSPHFVAAVKPPTPVNTPDGGGTTPFNVPHLFWDCVVNGPLVDKPQPCHALLDHGSHCVLISESWVNTLGLRRRKLPKPEVVELAMQDDKKEFVLHEWVKLQLHDPSNYWTSKTVRAIVAPGLCASVILGLPFLSHNNIVIDHVACTTINKITGFDILHPVPLLPPPPPCPRLREYSTH